MTLLQDKQTEHKHKTMNNSNTAAATRVKQATHIRTILKSEVLVCFNISQEETYFYKLQKDTKILNLVGV